MDTFNPYLLIAPTVMCFMGVALLFSWSFDRQQLSLRWMGIGYICTCIALTIQSLLPPALIASFAVYTAVLYMAGAWLCSCSIAKKFSASTYPRIAAVLAVATLCLLYYFSQVKEDLAMRASILSFCLGCLHILPVFNVMRRKPQNNIFNTYLYWSYLFFCIYTASRPLILPLFEHMFIQDLARSIYWFVTLLGSCLFCVTFAFLLLASSIRNTLKQLHFERNLDPLTHLLNRRALEESLQKAPTTPMSLIIGDIDHFKSINDNFGHHVGDQVLKEVAQCLQQSTRSGDLIARFGGEEFLVVLPHADTVTAQQVAQRIQTKLAHHSAALPESPKISMSFGIAALQAHKDFYQALRLADAELYKAKQAGRDRIFVAEPACA